MDTISGTKNDKQTLSEVNNDVLSLQACKVTRESKPACKLQNLGTRIPADTLLRFHNFVLNKHGKINGPFSQEVTKALESWMYKQQQTTSFTFSSSKAGHPRSDKIEKFRRIAMQLKQLKSFPYVNHFTLIHTIETVLGVCDKRTLNSYLTFIKKLSKEEIAPFGLRPMMDVSRFVKKIQSDDW